MRPRSLLSPLFLRFCLVTLCSALSIAIIERSPAFGRSIALPITNTDDPWVSVALPETKPASIKDYGAQAQSVASLGTKIEIPEPDPTGFLASEPLGYAELGEGARVVTIPQGMSPSRLLKIILNQESDTPESEELDLEGNHVIRLGSLEELERKRNQRAIMQARLQRAPAIPHQKARIQALDKITARITSIDIAVGAVARFGTLHIMLSTCLQAPPSEPPEDTAYLQIRDEPIEKEPYSAFDGWMFRTSPALSAMDHAIYDVWLVTCLEAQEEQEVREEQNAGENTPGQHDLKEHNPAKQYEFDIEDFMVDPIRVLNP